MVTTKVGKHDDPNHRKRSSDAKVKINKPKLNFKRMKSIWQQRLGINTKKEESSDGNKNDNDANKVYLLVPFSEIKLAKARGCQFDNIRRQWFSPVLRKDRTGHSQINFDHADNILKWKEKERIYFFCPFSKKDLVKPLGAKWCQEKRKWYMYKDESNIDNIITALVICDIPSREIMKIVHSTHGLFDQASILNRILLLVENKETTQPRKNTKLYDWENNFQFGSDHDLNCFLDNFFDIKPYLEDENWFTKNEGGKLYLKVPENKRYEAFQRGAKEDEKGEIFIDYSKMSEEKEDGDFGYLERSFYDPAKNGNRRASEYP